MKDYKEIAENVLKKRDEYLRIQKRRRSMIIKTVSSFMGVAAAACVSFAIYNNSTVHKIKPDFHGNPYDITECTKPTSAISTEAKAEICTTAVNATEPHVDITTETVSTECTDTTAVNTTETSHTPAMTFQTTASTAIESALIPVSKTTSAAYENPVTLTTSAIHENPVTHTSTIPQRTDIPEIHQTTDLQTTAIHYTSLTTAVTSKIEKPIPVTTHMQDTTMIHTHTTLTTSTPIYFTTELPQTTDVMNSTTACATTTDIYWTTTSEETFVTSVTFTATGTYTTSVTETTDLSTNETIPVTDTTTYLYFATTVIYSFPFDTDDVSTTTYTTIV